MKENKIFSGVIGVVIVSYNSGEEIIECLDSLLAVAEGNIRIVVVDNQSRAESIGLLQRWGRQKNLTRTNKSIPFFAELNDSIHVPRPIEEQSIVSLISNSLNAGYAGAVNLGIKKLLQSDDVNFFWILNPDCIVTESTIKEYRKFIGRDNSFGLLGGRINYVSPKNKIQSDGGILNQFTGSCHNRNQGKSQFEVLAESYKNCDFISGANMIVSRNFIVDVGLMCEDYFLYYEEVDWAHRRGNFRIEFCHESVTLHHGGTVIGTGAVDRAPSAFANYFNFRNRILFMSKFYKKHLVFSVLFSLAKVAKVFFTSGREPAKGALAGLLQLAPPKAVRGVLDVEAHEYAFKGK